MVFAAKRYLLQTFTINKDREYTHDTFADLMLVVRDSNDESEKFISLSLSYLFFLFYLTSVSLSLSLSDSILTLFLFAFSGL